MDERHFVFNLDHITEGRTAEHPERDQLIIKGYVTAHKNAGEGDSLQTCLVIAVERYPIINFAKDAIPGFTGNVSLVAYDKLTDFSEELDPTNGKYAAIVIQAAMV